MLQPIACSALMLAIAGSASAASSIAVNFTGWWPNETIGDGENTAALDAIAGLNSPVWTNLTKNPDGGAGPDGGTQAAVSDGTYGFNVRYHASSGWHAGSEGLVTATNDASQQIFRGYLDDGDGDGSYASGDGYGVTIQLSGLTDYLSGVGATSYQLTVFYSTDSDGFRDGELRQGTLSGGGAVSELALLQTLTPTMLGDGVAPFADPVPEGAQSESGGMRGYLTIGNLTEDEITLAFLTPDGQIRGSVAGFAITPVPEPGVSVLGFIGAVLLLRRRR